MEVYEFNFSCGSCSRNFQFKDDPKNNPKETRLLKVQRFTIASSPADEIAYTR